MPFPRIRPGILLIDVLVGVAVFSVFVGGTVFAMLYAQQSVLLSGDHTRAVFLSERAVEAVRSVRDGDFDDLTEGTHGVGLSSEGNWELSGTGNVTADGYETAITLTQETSDRFAVSANTWWNFGQSRSGSILLKSTLSDWRRAQPIGDWSSVSLEGLYIDEDNVLFNNAAATTTYLFVSSNDDEGAGLYIFDITDLASPLRVAETFNLGAAGGDMVIAEDTLYLVTDDSTQEVRIYDITDPVNFSAADLLGSINIPGNDRARAVAFFDDVLFVTAAESGGQREFLAYDVLDPGDVTVIDDLDDAGTYTDVRLHNGYAYVSSSMDTMEFRVIDIYEPSDLQFAPGGGYNVPDTPDGTAIAVFGTSALLGRSIGGVTDELVLFDISESPVPTPPPGPWYQNIGATIAALDHDPTGAYAFIATDHSDKEFQVMDVGLFKAGQPPEVETYDTGTGNGRGVTYSAVHDRVFFMTNTAVLILEPS